jgi:hypothetical protein
MVEKASPDISCGSYLTHPLLGTNFAIAEVGLALIDVQLQVARQPTPCIASPRLGLHHSLESGAYLLLLWQGKYRTCHCSSLLLKGVIDFRAMRSLTCTSVPLQLKVGDKTETVRYFHCYKRGVDRVFVDHPLFLAKVRGSNPQMKGSAVLLSNHFHGLTPWNRVTLAS